MKKFIAAIMMIALVVVMAVSVSAEDLTEGIYTYVVNEDGQTVTITKISVTETMELNIPSTIAGKTVTAIGEKALRWGSTNTLVTKLTIPDTVVTIGASAFDNNRGIKELVIPESVTTIGAQAFIKFHALENLTIGSKVTSIGSAAFGRTKNLKTITITGGNNEYFKVENGCLVDVKNKGLLTAVNNETITTPAGVEYIDEYAFYDKAGIKTVVISDGVKLLKTTSFQSAAAMDTVIIPKSVETIENAVFVNGKMGTGNVYYEGTEDEYKAINWVVNPDTNTTQNNDVLVRATVHYNSCMNNPNGWTHSEGETCTYCTPAGGNQGGNNTGNEGGNKAPQTGSAVTLLAVVAVVALAATSVVIKRRIED